MSIQTLTVKKIAAACRSGILTRTLLAEAADYGEAERICLYDDGHGHHCAIGIAMTKTTLKRIKHRNEADLVHLVEERFVEVAGDNDLQTLMELQVAHDNWLQIDPSQPAHDEYKQEFLDLLADIK